ncbi:MAG TPA: carboxypeptidase-like regulatory domain-containing protein [Pyrinomonadaceae bacterium]
MSAPRQLSTPPARAARALAPLLARALRSLRALPSACAPGLTFALRLTVAACLASAFCLARARAQADGQEALRGRVVTEDGQPVGNAQVFAFSPNRRRATATTDADGQFTLRLAERGAYTVSAYAPGYVDAATLPREPTTPPVYYHAGETASVRLIKGGVITGRVTDARGEPVVAARVRVFAARVIDGRRTFVAAGPPVPRALSATDDRGVYRLYGLPPGEYILAAGGESSGLLGLPSAYDEDAPTFYPSTTRDGAVTIALQSGQELTDVDVRYRGEPGHTVSGVVDTGGVPGGTSSCQVRLMPVGFNAGDARLLFGDAQSFVFGGVADGDYDLIAERYDNDPARAAAVALRVRVRGADVTGLRPALVPLAALSGRVVLEVAPPAAASARAADATSATDANAGERASCRAQPGGALVETLVFARRAAPPNPDQPRTGGASGGVATPDEKGAFVMRAIAPGRFRLDVRPPSPDWYVRAVTLAAAPPAAAPRAAETGLPAEGFTLASGAQLAGLTVALAPGAAELRGRAVPATEGAALPALRLFLVPDERERADDALRYAFVDTDAAGAYAFPNLAPGRYRLLARPAPARERPDTTPPVFDAPTRTRLRRQAESAPAVELQPCQRLADHTLRYAP